MRFIGLLFALLFSFRTMASSPTDLRLYGEKAPVQLYVFTSLSCFFCSEFHKRILPILKREYASTGKAQIVMVDLANSDNALIATALVRCLDGKKREVLEDELYKNQAQWMRKEVEEAREALFNYAKRQGMDKKAFNSCIYNTNLRETIMEQQNNLVRLYNVSRSPTLIMRKGTEVRKWEGSDKEAVLKGLKDAFQK